MPDDELLQETIDLTKDIFLKTLDTAKEFCQETFQDKELLDNIGEALKPVAQKVSEVLDCIDKEIQ